MTIDHPSTVHLHGLKQLWGLAFGDGEAFIDGFFATAFRPENCLCVHRWETVAAALYWLDCSYKDTKTAYIYAVATHPEFRGQGLCRALMEKAHGVLRQRGYDLAVLVPSDGLLGQMYGRLGYRYFGGMDSLWASAGEKCDLRQLSAREYVEFRRIFLPEGGVLQEGVTLDYLAGFAQFYAGEDLLLCASVEDGKVMGMELLGNREKAPGIVAALGAKEGAFRVPGEKPFAMGLALRENAPLPGYFGLALD